jgi:hypothetical protein
MINCRFELNFNKNLFQANSRAKNKSSTEGRSGGFKAIQEVCAIKTGSEPAQEDRQEQEQKGDDKNRQASNGA